MAIVSPASSSQEYPGLTKDTAEKAADLGERYTGYVPHVAALGMRTVDIGRGYAVMALPYQRQLVGDPETGVLHGGVVTTLIDSVAGLCVLATMAEPGPIATLDLRIDYLQPASPGKELLARAECYRMTRSIAFVRALAYHEDQNEQVAASQATFIVKGQGGGLAADGRRG